MGDRKEFSVVLCHRQTNLINTKNIYLYLYIIIIFYFLESFFVVTPILILGLLKPHFRNLLNRSIASKTTSR